MGTGIKSDSIKKGAYLASSLRHGSIGKRHLSSGSGEGGYLGQERGGREDGEAARHLNDARSPSLSTSRRPRRKIYCQLRWGRRGVRRREVRPRSHYRRRREGGRINENLRLCRLWAFFPIFPSVPYQTLFPKGLILLPLLLAWLFYG